MKSKRLFLKSICSLPLFLGFNHKLIAKPIEIKHVKPKNVLLNQFPIAGFQYYQGKEVIIRLRENDELVLLAEPDNQYDKYAVEVYYQSVKLGYIPKKENRHISRILQKGSN